jgi:hypothetical protein
LFVKKAPVALRGTFPIANESDRISRLIVLPAEATVLRAMVVGALAQNRLQILDTKSAAIGTHELIRKSGGRGTKNPGQGESYCGIFVSIVISPAVGGAPSAPMPVLRACANKGYVIWFQN